MRLHKCHFFSPQAIWYIFVTTTILIQVAKCARSDFESVSNMVYDVSQSRNNRAVPPPTYSMNSMNSYKNYFYPSYHSEEEDLLPDDIIPRSASHRPLRFPNHEDSVQIHDHPSHQPSHSHDSHHHNQKQQHNRFSQDDRFFNDRDPQTSASISSPKSKFPKPKRVTIKVEDDSASFKACGGFSSGATGTCCSACFQLNYHKGCWCRTWDCLCFDK